MLDQNGIPAQILFKDPERPNVVARLKGNGRKRPLLLLGHIDTVTVDAVEVAFPPFSATRDGGYVYGRGAIDDKDNLAAALMTMLLLKRQNVPLDRDVILLAESGEEGASNLGIGYMMAEHYPEIDAEYCIAEGGDTIREGGEVRYATVQVTEKVVRGVELTAHGISGHGSVPLKSNADRASRERRRPVHDLAARHQDRRNHRHLLPPAGDAGVAGAGEVLPRRDLAGPEGGERRGGLAVRARAPPCLDGAHLGVAEHLHRRLSLERDSVRGQGPARRAHGARAKMPRRCSSRSGRPSTIPAVDVQFAGGGGQRPAIPATRLDSELFKTRRGRGQRGLQGAHPALDEHLRHRHVAAAREGRAVRRHRLGVDIEDQTKGFGMHSDQERLLESELQRFVRLNWEIVTGLAARR